ncbi:MAG: cytochrome c [Myxococcota bacterium]
MRWGLMAVTLIACEEDDAPNPEDTGAPVASDVSYADVEPILISACGNCHGDPLANGAPFALNSFETSAPRADRIVARAVDGVPSPMPPAGLVLSDEEAQLLVDWADAGAPE